MRPLGRILALWRPRWPFLLAGLLISLASAAAGVALTAVSGSLVAGMLAGGAVVAPLLVRVIGPVRVVLRYLERLVTHDATFRALADLRVWFFSGLAARAAGGLGFRHAGDVLARLVNDVEALDGLFLRILVPLACAVLLLPVLLVFGWRDSPALAIMITVLFAIGAFLLPAFIARGAVAGGEKVATAGSALRIAALDAIVGLREVKAFGAEGRMLAAMQSREAALMAAQREQAHSAAAAGAAAFLCGQAAVLTVLIFTHHAQAAVVVFVVVAAFETVGGLPRAGALAGLSVAAARRVLEAAEGPIPVRDPVSPAPPPPGHALRFEGVVFRWQPDRPPVFRGLTLEIPQGSRVALLGPSGAGQIHPGRARAQGGGARAGQGAPRRHRHRHPRRGGCPGADRLAVAVDASVRRHHPPQSPPRAAGCRRCGAMGGARCGADRRHGARSGGRVGRLGRRGRRGILGRAGQAPRIGARAAVRRRRC